MEQGLVYLYSIYSFTLLSLTSHQKTMLYDLVQER